ncbi:hypothetical protein [Vibrio agarivorans]|nr:hypothetical protein [Vibrio agarivorans]MDN3661050.1 hypothetical protein [Vibrio agarivorans]
MIGYEYTLVKFAKVSVYTNALSINMVQLAAQKPMFSIAEFAVFEGLMDSAVEFFNYDGELTFLEVVFFDFDKLKEMNYVAASLLYSIDVDQSEHFAAINQHMLHLSNKTVGAIRDMDNGFRNDTHSRFMNVFLIAFLFFIVIELFQKNRNRMVIFFLVGSLAITFVMRNPTDFPFDAPHITGDYNHAFE